MAIPDRIASLMARTALVVVLAAVAATIVGPFIYFGGSMYLMWHRGYGDACDSRTLSEALSPSKQWIARARLISCSGVAGGQSADVVLVPNVLIPLAVRYRLVFNRNIESDTRQRGDRLTVHWIDDHSLELQGAPCPACQSQGHREPCDAECRVVNDVNGIAVSITSVEDPRERVRAGRSP